MDEASLTGLTGSGLGGKTSGLLSGMTAGSMIAALFFSLVGFVYLKQGKANADVTKMVCGLALLLYTFFVSGTFYTVLIGAALTAAPFISDRF